MSDNPFKVEFKKRGKPHWVPANKETGRPGYWVPSYPRVMIYNYGLVVIFPEDEDDKKKAINSAIDRAQKLLDELRPTQSVRSMPSRESMLEYLKTKPWDVRWMDAVLDDDEIFHIYKMEGGPPIAGSEECGF